MPACSVKTRRASCRYCKDARAYGHTTARPCLISSTFLSPPPNILPYETTPHVVFETHIYVVQRIRYDRGCLDWVNETLALRSITRAYHRILNTQCDRLEVEGSCRRMIRSFLLFGTTCPIHSLHLFIDCFWFPASRQAVATGVVPSAPPI